VTVKSTVSWNVTPSSLVEADILDVEDSADFLLLAPEDGGSFSPRNLWKLPPDCKESDPRPSLFMNLRKQFKILSNKVKEISSSFFSSNSRTGPMACSDFYEIHFFESY
jgi:hypothetical protein